MNRRRSRRAAVASLTAVLLSVAAPALGTGLSPTPSASPSPTATPRRTPEPTPSGSPSQTPSETPSQTPSESPSDGTDGEPAPTLPPDPLGVVIDRITPGVVPTRGNLVVSGTVVNRSTSDWSDLSVYLLTSTEPMTTPRELEQAMTSDPRAFVGERLVDPGLYVDVPDLAPGRSTRFRLSVPAGRLEISGAPGVYWLGVHVLGTSDIGRVDGADGRARTLLPLVPPGNPGTTVALGVQVRNHVVRAPDGQLQDAQGWQETLSRGGRLRRVLDFSSGAGKWPLSWLVDPAVVDAADSMARGNPPLDLDAEPVGATEGSDGKPVEGPGTAEARDWLGDFARQARRRTVLALPYGDLDVSAAVRNGDRALVGSAFSLGAALLQDLSVSSSPILDPPNGRLLPAAFDALEPDVPVVLGPGAVTGAGPPDTQPLFHRAGGRPILVTPTGSALFGPPPGASRSALAVRQRLLAEAALHALSRHRDEPLVRLLPPGWDPGQDWHRAGFFRGLDVPWLRSTPLTGVLDGFGPAPVVDPSKDLAYTDDDAATELRARAVGASRTLIDAGRTLEDLLTDESVIDDQVSRQALTTASVWSRPRPGIAADRAFEAASTVNGWLDRITVRGPSFVTMSSGSGTFQVTVVNGLDHAVTVDLRMAVSGAGFELSDPVPVDLAPKGRSPVQIKANATDIGIHQVRLQPVTADGTPVGTPSTLSIRSSRVGFILWVVMAVGGGLLFVAIVFRIWRRVRQRRRTHGPLLERRTG